MAVRLALAPRFGKGQRVNFIGGSGTIKSCRPDAGRWSYLIEMEMGPEPEMGRIGYETTIQLTEADLSLWENNCLSELPPLKSARCNFKKSRKNRDILGLLLKPRTAES
jgi:hypothetical protein